VKEVRRHTTAAFVTLLALLASVWTGIVPGGGGRAGLRLAVARDAAALGARRDEKPANRISDELLEAARSEGAGDRRVRVILQTGEGASAELSALLRRPDVKTKGQLAGLGTRVVELPARLVEELSEKSGVRFVSPDREMVAFGHVSLTTGADLVRDAGPANPTGLDGTGIGIAVLDSGIDTGHIAFRSEKGNTLRVVVSRDFTGENRIDDPYGHGTHVASIAAGNGRVAHNNYLGIAPAAGIINLRVLDSHGTGRVSNILAALDWVLQNRSAYNIRVVNLSLGAPAVDSYKNDPVCQAVRRLVDAGIVVVAAAGNLGKDASGNKIYGAIHSPGDEPSALTVGASNTFGTDARSDDGVTTYSSRGPTRGVWTDASGTKHHDNLVKPDIVAPGNKIIDAAADGNYLITTYPSLDAGVSEADNRRMMYLNGTSMATPATAGAVALMLQANPKLTPNLVKAILMYTAQPLAGFNMLEQGTGELNIEGAVRLARLVRTDLSDSTRVGSPLLTSLVPPLPQTTIAGETFVWSQGLVLNYGFATGVSLITRYQKIYACGVLVTDGVVVSDGVLVTDKTLVSDGVLVTDGVVVSDGGSMSGSSLFVGAGVLVTDQFFAGDGVLVTDNALGADSVTQAMSAAIGGDATAATAPALDDCEGCAGVGVAAAGEDGKQATGGQKQPGEASPAGRTTPRARASRSRID
jgi:serine protease AprX